MTETRMTLEGPGGKVVLLLGEKAVKHLLMEAVRLRYSPVTDILFDTTLLSVAAMAAFAGAVDVKPAPNPATFYDTLLRLRSEGGAGGAAANEVRLEPVSGVPEAFKNVFDDIDFDFGGGKEG